MDHAAAERTNWQQRCMFFLGALVLLYAAIASHKTVVDFDLGWQIATGRYLVQHHSIPHTDVFAYTIPGVPWIYSQLSCLLFYVLFQFGSYSAISVFCSVATVFTALCLVWKRGILAQILALIAIPVLASEIMPRASLFTVVLFALMGRLLVCYQQGRRLPLWPLPLFMVLWTNLHLGFPAGIALVAAYVLVEVCDLPFARHRAAAQYRLRQAARWLLLCLPAMLISPFGLGIFSAVMRQQQAVRWQTVLLEEWQPLQLGLARTELGWRNPQSALWWLMLFGLVLVIGLLAKRRFGPAVILVAAGVALLQHRRMEGPAILVLCLIAGPTLDAVETRLGRRFPKRAWLAVVALVVAIFTAVRISDVVSDRTTLAQGQLTRFGTGPSWFLPQQAVQALTQMRVDGNVFAPFSLGSYLIQQGLPVFADGRAVPFGQSLIERQQQLTATPLDDPQWQQAAAQYNINAVLLPLAHISALGDAPLQQDCASHAWAPVFFDDTAILFLRRTSRNADRIANAAIDCAAYKLPDTPAVFPIDRYEHLVNAAGIYTALARVNDATVAIQQAQAITTKDDPTLLFLQAQVAMASGVPLAAEVYLHRTLALQPSDAGWYNLAVLLAAQQRFADASEAMTHSIPLSQQSWDRYRTLGDILLGDQQTQHALDAYTQAEQRSPYALQSTPAAREFRASIATGRARAALQQGDIAAALEQMRNAVAETPANAPRHQFLARICTEGHAACTPEESQGSAAVP